MQRRPHARFVIDRSQFLDVGQTPIARACQRQTFAIGTGFIPRLVGGFGLLLREVGAVVGDSAIGSA